MYKFRTASIVFDDPLAVVVYDCEHSCYNEDRMEKGIRANDALHIACAIDSRCEYFITTDAGLTNKEIDGIKIINPIDFVRKMEEGNEN